MKNFIEKYFQIIRFKKFMMVYVLVFTMAIITGSYVIIRNRAIMTLEDIFINVGGLVLAYLCLRLYQEFWIRRGAADNYFYFFGANKKNNKNK